MRSSCVHPLFFHFLSLLLRLTPVGEKMMTERRAGHRGCKEKRFVLVSHTGPVLFRTLQLFLRAKKLKKKKTSDDGSNERLPLGYLIVTFSFCSNRVAFFFVLFTFSVLIELLSLYYYAFPSIYWIRYLK